MNFHFPQFRAGPAALVILSTGLLFIAGCNVSPVRPIPATQALDATTVPATQPLASAQPAASVEPSAIDPAPAAPTETPSHPRPILGIIPDYNSIDSSVGVIVAGIMPGGPAETAGMKPGDLIVQFDNTGLQNLNDLSILLGSTSPGQKVDIKILRGNQTLTLPVTLAERKDKFDGR
jgi:membrane-associated protease RseP (regulator of RpoE activity)